MLFAQAVGFAGAAVACFSYQCRSSRRLFLVQFFACLMFAAHFFLLGAFTGLFLNAVELIRSFFLIQKGKKWASHPAAMALVMLLPVICGALTWDGWLSLLPTAAMVIGAPFLWTRKGKVLRLANLCFISPCWLIYNVFVFSIAGILTECCNILSVLLSFLRFGRKGLDGKDGFA